MANFQIALTQLLKLEGGYVNNSHDAGGETVCGITRVNNPMWPGWSLIDQLHSQYPNIKDLNETIFAHSYIMQLISNFYEQIYWNFDIMVSQLVANKLFDMEVNFGKGTAVKILQESLSKLGYEVVQDGSLGTQTLTTLALVPESLILQYLRAYSCFYRFHRVQSNPDQQTFLEGWLIRDCQ